ncbi:MAG: hypothetical protein IT208_07105 [Chthonomonadales bacterium]|nr:hypothetical protein [Chthonomonadales bacterium]
MTRLRLAAAAAALATAAPARADSPSEWMVRVSSAPRGVPVVARLRLPEPVLANAAVEVRGPTGRVDAQWAPDAAPPGARVRSGTMVLPDAPERELTLRFRPGGQAARPVESVSVRGGGFRIRFDRASMAGLPSAVEFAGDRRFRSFAWNDRLHDPSAGGFLLRADPAPRLEVVSEGPICTVVRVAAHYTASGGARPPTAPRAVYDWYVFHGAPLVHVAAAVRQDAPRAWAEAHFLELNYPDDRFTSWAGGDPAETGKLQADQTTRMFGRWALVTDGHDAVAMLGESIRLHDGRGHYGTYLHSTWEPWSGTERRFGSWLWLGAAPDPVPAVREAAGRVSLPTSAVMTTRDLRRRIAAMRERAGRTKGRAGQEARWRASLAESEEARGRLGEAGALADGVAPRRWMLARAGDLGIALRSGDGGIALASLHDLVNGVELLATEAPPLFAVTLSEAGEGRREVVLTSETGWGRASVLRVGEGLRLEWADPEAEAARGVRVLAVATPEPATHRWRWSLRVVGVGRRAGAAKVAFPQVALRRVGPATAAFYPSGPGIVTGAPWSTAYSQRSMYPNGWCTMQYMALLTGGGAGLYMAMHDPLGGAKEIVLEGRPAEGAARFAFEMPAPDMRRPGTGFSLSGEAIWQLFRGDWFDAARIYRAWARRSARWWPDLGRDGREDSPLWMRELNVWAQTGGAPADCQGPVTAMAEALDLPIGFHWYNWHEIPFDNDYPHYFPTKLGVAEAVRELQAAHVYVMPYINGRLWDTHDRGAEDWKFTAMALPAATKQDDGKPFVETYGSKETDGTPVSLAAMCPTTALWQRTVRETALRLMTEIGTRGVYIDQIAAAAPVLCMDASHGHPLGGGHWWTEKGYWPLLAALRRAMPPGHVLTTECNAEPYIRWMDGYLTWHWQSDGMVPAFPAVYGGAIQMFGRAYNAGAGTRDLALCAKMGQQLVFGEQIGWLDPAIAREPVAGAFLHAVARMRNRYRRFFYAGEMARQPALRGEMPRVRSDWAWYGETWVTTDAVLTGAWRLPAERRMVLLFANTSDRPVRAELAFDARAAGIAADRVRVAVVDDPDARAAQATLPARFRRRMEFPARSVRALEIGW